MPLTELEFIIQLSISQLVREYYPESLHVLLLPEHPRLIGKYQKLISDHFDETINLPYISFSKNWREISKVKNTFVKRLGRVDSTGPSIWFACGMQDMIHFWLCRFIRKNKDRKINKLIRIETFINLEKGSEIDLKNSIIMCSSALLFAGVFSWALRHRVTKTLVEQKNFPKLYDIRINIEHQLNKKNKKIVTFNFLPFPLACVLKNNINRYSRIHLENESIIIFLDNTLIDNNICDENEYWDGVNILIKELSIIYGESKILLKFHPSSSESLYAKIVNSNLKHINKTISAEEIYLHNRTLIRGVFSGGSTALITASWLGIPAYDCSIPFGFKKEHIEHFKPYYKHAPHIEKIKNLSDISNNEYQLNFNQINIINQKNIDMQVSKWNSVFRDLEDIIQA